MLGQVATDAKSNEITAVPQPLKLLSLEGCIVTVDALNCQRDIAQQVIDQNGNYIMALKGNPGTLDDDVRRFQDDPASDVDTAPPVADGDHGRIETRTATVSTHIDWLQEPHKRAGPGSDRQDRPDARDDRQDDHRDRVLFGFAK